MEPFSEEGERRLYILQVAQTNDLGEYRFFWLPPGPYYIAVVPENTRGRSVVSVQPPPGQADIAKTSLPLSSSPHWPNGEDDGRNLRYGLLSQRNETERAQPIQVQPGSTTSGWILFLRPPEESARITSAEWPGTLVTGEARSRRPAAACSEEWSATVIMPTATVDQKGNFDIAGAVPGSYVLVGKHVHARSLGAAAGNAPGF